MSGHSKWQTTKRKKEATDKKRSKIFAKHAKLVTVATRDSGGGNPDMNPNLRMAIDNAKAASMPKENIERAIQKGTGDGNGGRIEEIIYEAFGPERSAFLIECLTDNKNRALTEVKSVFTKNGGNMVPAGNVSYLFEKKGEIVLDESKNTLKGDDLEIVAIDAGADDIESSEGFVFVYTNYKDLNSVKKALEREKVVIDTAELSFIVKSALEVNDKGGVERVLDLLDDLDDVNKVYTNVNL